MMRRDKVEHILRAAGVVTGRSEFVLIGSAAIVAWRTSLPEPMIVSRDIDLFAYDAPDADLISEQLDGALGQASPFDSEFGYYCDGVGAETAILPCDWLTRAMRSATLTRAGLQQSYRTLMTSRFRSCARVHQKTLLGCAPPSIIGLSRQMSCALASERSPTAGETARLWRVDWTRLANPTASPKAGCWWR